MSSQDVKYETNSSGVVIARKENEAFFFPIHPSNNFREKISDLLEEYGYINRKSLPSKLDKNVGFFHKERGEVSIRLFTPSSNEIVTSIGSGYIKKLIRLVSNPPDYFQDYKYSMSEVQEGVKLIYHENETGVYDALVKESDLAKSKNEAHFLFTTFHVNTQKFVFHLPKVDEPSFIFSYQALTDLKREIEKVSDQ